jgi:hypothetical protein
MVERLSNLNFPDGQMLVEFSLFLLTQEVVHTHAFLHASSLAHRRDLMSKCVIELVRHWFPNLQDKEYMGHMWE